MVSFGFFSTSEWQWVGYSHFSFVWFFLWPLAFIIPITRPILLWPCVLYLVYCIVLCVYCVCDQPLCMLVCCWKAGLWLLVMTGY